MLDDFTIHRKRNDKIKSGNPGPFPQWGGGAKIIFYGGIWFICSKNIEHYFTSYLCEVRRF